VQVCNYPYHYFHVKYPKDIVSSVVRKEARVDVALKSTIKNTKKSREDDSSIVGFVNDLNLSGCCLKASDVIGNPGDTVRVTTRMSVAGVEDFLEVSGVIRNVKAEKDPVTSELIYFHGVEFADLQRSHSLLLHGYLFEQVINEKR
jgi:c-di-GMP-binding flagellar brake protein YcgR